MGTAWDFSNGTLAHKKVTVEGAFLRVSIDAEPEDSLRAGAVGSMHKLMASEHGGLGIAGLRRPDYAPHFRLWIRNGTTNTDYVVAKACKEEGEKLADIVFSVEKLAKATGATEEVSRRMIDNLQGKFLKEREVWSDKIEQHRKECL